MDIFDTYQQSNTVSNPDNPQYDQNNEWYDHTADSSSQYFFGEVTEHVTSARDHVLKHLLLTLVGDVTGRIKLERDFHDQQTASIATIRNKIRTAQNGEAPRTPWDTMSHTQMDAKIKNEANSALVGDFGKLWIDTGNALSDHKSQVSAAMQGSVNIWQGDAGNMARARLSSVNQWLENTTEGSWLSGQQQELHSHSLIDAQRNMEANPPVMFSAREANLRLQQITDPVEHAKQWQLDMDSYNKQKAAREQAVKHMTEFDDMVGGNATIPEFPTPPVVNEPTDSRDHGKPDSTDTPPPPPPGKSFEPKIPDQVQPIMTPTPEIKTPTEQDFVHNGQGTKDIFSPNNINPEQTHQASDFPAPRVPVANGNFVPTELLSGSGSSGHSSGSSPLWTTTGTPGGAPGGTSSGKPGSPENALNKGKLTGANPGERLIGESGARGSAGAAANRGAPGSALPPPGGGGGGRGAEDEEHRRPAYLIDYHSQEYFESDAKVTPPVIGALPPPEEKPKR